MRPGRVPSLRAKCQLVTAGRLLLATEVQQVERNGKRRERDQASSGNRSRENEEVKGDVCVVSDL